MKYEKRMTMLLGMDFLLIGASVYWSYFLRFDGAIPDDWVRQLAVYVLISSVIHLSLMHYFKLYKRIWKFASIGEAVSIIRAIAIGSIVSYVFHIVIMREPVQLEIAFLSFVNVLFAVGGSRFVWRIVRDGYDKRGGKKDRALIIGAGSCGSMIAKELKFNSSANMIPVLFIDDDNAKHKCQVHGIPVIGGREMIHKAVEQYDIGQIIIAIPSASKCEMKRIIELCKSTKAKLKLIPILNDLIEGKVSINEIRDVEVEDLLGREPVTTDLHGIAGYVEGKTVLVTGAGGSIGSELCRQVARFRPDRLLLLGHGENSIYNIEMELRRSFPGLALMPIIADIQDMARMDEVFGQYRPQVVFHAAAHKHVPLMERNPAAAIKNNVLGTKNVAQCASKYAAERFVLISTDKAVNPTNVMGATKRLAEMIVQSLSRNSQTVFAAVRFGNVLGSRGSVIPRFKEQIKQGGPVTVTHPDMVRYFMTIPEAVQLVIQAGALAQGGEVFILDMGKPVRIVDLAKDLIRLSGFEPDKDISIEFTGIREGEKLFEELLTDEEGISSTKHDRIYIGKPAVVDAAPLFAEIDRLHEIVMQQDLETFRTLLQLVVPGYHAAPEEAQTAAVPGQSEEVYALAGA
ncbi:nucleoside-diphosphate sugar epimerase/dehydratase [Paenibacillus sp. MSJ-34]|uniref:nucleoside-diphosphate sugar epimerase/dehydratase n=1 Tax=Paenibacillus sp. MSJ-34 TaxID=2841529 RepID=UPI001C1032A2|nr:nucleoside-diphosphate sugar epimerase/dehydratase [Paenibacillus sp. MSJ-34]MBU5443475.1 polysaccharide biosynthesis protein [Paenibacillus sp. MSJ-34]